MSLLVDLLSKIKKERKSKAVSPLLEHVSTQKKRPRKGAYLYIVVGALGSVIAGFMVVYFISQTEKHSSIDVTVVKNKSKVVGKPSIVRADKNSVELVSKGFGTESVEKNKTKPLKKQRVDKKREVLEKTIKTLPAKIDKKTVKISGKTRIQKNVKKKVNNKKDIDYYIYYAVKAEKHKKYSEAITLYQKALEIEQDNYRLLNEIAYLLIKTGNYEDAIGYAKRALQVKSDYVQAMINLSVALQKIGKIRAAIDVLNSALKWDPYNVKVKYNLAILYERSGELKKAEKIFYTLSSHGNVKAIIGLGRIKEKEGRYAEALSFYNKALSREDLGEDLKKWLRNRIFALKQTLQ